METLNTMPFWEREKAYEKMYDEELDKVIELENKIDTLNKGIDELLEKYENKLDNLTLVRGIDEKCNIHNAETRARLDCYCEIIQDLKKLKGE